MRTFLVIIFIYLFQLFLIKNIEYKNTITIGDNDKEKRKLKTHKIKNKTNKKNNQILCFHYKNQYWLSFTFIEHRIKGGM